MAPVVATGRIYAATKSRLNAGQLDCQSRIMVDVIARCDLVATKHAASFCEAFAVAHIPTLGCLLALARRSGAGLSSGPRPGQLFRHLFPRTGRSGRP